MTAEVSIEAVVIASSVWLAGDPNPRRARYTVMTVTGDEFQIECALEAVPRVGDWLRVTVTPIDAPEPVVWTQ